MAGAAATTSYTFTEFRAPGAFYTYAEGLNNLGQIVGRYSIDGAAPKSFLLQDGRYTFLDAPGNEGNEAASVNDLQQVVGRAIDLNPGPGGTEVATSTGFLLSHGVHTPVTPPGSAGSYPADINDRGQVVGYFDGPTGDEGFLDEDGAFSVIAPPDAKPVTVGNSVIQPSVLPNGINNRGEIVGEYFSYPSDHGFLDDNGTFTKIDVPGATFTQPRSINDFGVIVGDYVNASGAHGFIYDRGTYATVDAPGGTNTELQSVNDLGQIVGNANVGDTGAAFSFLMKPAAGPGPSTLADLLASAGLTPAAFFAGGHGTPADAAAFSALVAGSRLQLPDPAESLSFGAVPLSHGG